MVRVLALLLLLPLAVWAEDSPVLYGDGGGRLWSWQNGQKTWLTPEGQNLVLGGVTADSLWGWSTGPQARFFTLPLPKKTGKTPPTPAAPRFEKTSFPAPEAASRSGELSLLVFSAHDRPRYEVWKGSQKVAARAWDDGRSVYAAAVDANGWLVAGRTAGGEPWLEVSGQQIPAPEGWRGRLTVALWSAGKPWAAGWGAPGSQAPGLLLWGPDGWAVPEPDEEIPPPRDVFPLLGAPGEEGLRLAGWQADASGAMRPWFWNGESVTPGGVADGQPQAFSMDEGTFLVVRHASAPWFTFEDGTQSTPLEGLDESDRVVSVAAKAEPAKQ